MLATKLRDTFGSDLANLTFVCIPASTVVDNDRRYKNFSNSLCSTLGMRDAFPYITITKEKEQTHLGGTDEAEYSFNRAFFEGDKVVLFDDVVTRGHSMFAFKQFMEQLHATVICAISIGRTYSDYYGDKRLPHPYTGTL